MLLGRTDERLALDRTLARAREGHSAVLALVGEPGIGKTALLDHVAERTDGMRLLRSRGIESEAVIPFAGLAELLRPLLGALDRIPQPQASALSAALALGPPGGARDRFAIGAAALSLLSASAEDGPLALLVDDAHWLDRPSAGALLFAARRLLADPVALVIAVREGHASLLDGADLPVLRLAGLGRGDAAELLSTSHLTDDALERLHRATGGNPLALLQLGPEAARLPVLPSETPLPISTSIATAFLRRFGELPEPTRRVLLLAAAGDSCEPAVLERAAASLGLTIEQLAPAEAAGLVTIALPGIEFAHPLARAATYADAPAPARREAHRALAAALPDRDADRRAWHLAAASAGPDDRVAAALEQAGGRARERSAYAAAAAAFERAAGLTTGEDARGERLFAAADAAWLAGDAQRTTTLLAEAAKSASSPALAARVDNLRGQVALRCGPVTEGYPLIAAAAERIAGLDPEQAVAMLAQVVYGCFYTGDTQAMLAASSRAVALARDGGASSRATFLATTARGIALVADGQGEDGAAATRESVAILEASAELREDPALIAWAAVGPLFLREAETGRSLIEQAFTRVREQASLGSLPALLHLLARDQATTDQWTAAEAGYDEAIRLARETGQRVELAAALAGLAWLEARQGREVECHAHATEAVWLCGELGVGLFGLWAVQARGDLELGLGRPEAAIEHYRAQAGTLAERGIADVDLSPAPELVEALLRLGEPEEARALTESFARDAAAKGQPWALARACRCRGLLAEGDEVEPCFEEALALHARTPDVFETARTRLAFGARLRRGRKRVRAREQLTAAAEAFERLGARSWAEQATTELAATGVTARRRDASTLDELTPQELRIAGMLATGRTTREAAAAIFVSPKTVEYHLRHVYEKLGINSRAQLAELFDPAEGGL